MSSDEEMEDSMAPDELTVLKEQLETYQRLNVDLSKKIQEIKITLAATTRELSVSRNELVAEKVISSELRLSMRVLVGQVNSFFAGYVNNIETVVQRTNVNLTMPGDYIGSLQKQSKTPTTKADRPVRAPPSPNAPNLIYTICEESMASLNEESMTVDEIAEQQSGFLQNQPIFASTPFVAAQRPVPTDVVRSSPETEISDVNEAPQCSFSNLSVDIDGQDSFAILSRPNLPAESIPDTQERATSETREPTSETQEPTSETQEPTLTNESNDPVTLVETLMEEEPVDHPTFTETIIEEPPVDEVSHQGIKLKEFKINIEPIALIDPLIQKYLEDFGGNRSDSNALSSVPLEDFGGNRSDSNDLSSVRLEDFGGNKSDSNDLSSVDQSESYLSESSEMPSESSRSIASSTNRRRRIQKPRVSTGRPKRCVRLKSGSLAEKSLRSKMRRSK